MPDLSKASEGCLLQFAMAIYRLNHPNEKERSVFAQTIGRSESSIDQCVSDGAHIGTLAWLKLEKLIGVKLFSQWLDAQQSKLEFTNKS